MCVISKKSCEWMVKRLLTREIGAASEIQTETAFHCVLMTLEKTWIDFVLSPAMGE